MYKCIFCVNFFIYVLQRTIFQCYFLTLRASYSEPLGMVPFLLRIFYFPVQIVLGGIDGNYRLITPFYMVIYPSFWIIMHNSRYS